MNPLQLRYFTTICDCSSNMTAAAGSLGITQPTISLAINELEEELGVKLFYRAGNRLQLTQEGIRCYELASDVLSKVDAFTDHMSRIASGVRQIRLAIPTMTGTLLQPTVIKDFKLAHPDIEVDISIYQSLRIPRLLRSDRVDMAIINTHTTNSAGSENLINPDEYEAHTIMHVQLMFCTHIRNPLAKLDEVDYSQLADEPLVLIKYPDEAYKRIEHNFGDAGLEPNILFYTDQISTIRELVSANEASTILFSQLIKKNDPITCIPIKGRSASPINLVYKKSRALSPECELLRDFILNYDIQAVL